MHRRCLVRIVNLELLSQYDSNEWRLHNELVSHMVDHETKELRSLKNEVQEVNWQRKTEQTNVGTQLEELNNHWITLVYRNFEIERECLKVQREIDYLKRKAEERKILKVKTLNHETNETLQPVDTQRPCNH